MNNKSNINPFEIKSKSIEEYLLNWNEMYPTPYDKNKVSPWTKVRVILMNGTEFESNWFMHQFARHTDDNDLRRDLALVRRQEQQQQKRISLLKPIDETILEETIGYEQLAIELTAILAQNEENIENKKALDFALLEDFDHLYRFANLLKMDYGIEAENLVGKYTEIMPGRPTISEHRHPYDSIRIPMKNKKNKDFSKLVANIITAAEQQTMNFYMNMAQMYGNDLGRRLFAEIGMIEEQHVSQYESLKDPNASWFECWVMHEYTECYLYYSMKEQETCKHIKKIWEEHFEMEVAHLNLALSYLRKYTKKDIKDLFKEPSFPELLIFGENKEYIRNVINETVYNTSKMESYIDNREYKQCARFSFYQDIVNAKDDMVASHKVIKEAIKLFGEDYRFEETEHPIKELQKRSKDNTTIGRECIRKSF